MVVLSSLCILACSIAPLAFGDISGLEGLKVGYPGEARFCVRRNSFGRDHHVKQGGFSLRNNAQGSLDGCRQVFSVFNPLSVHPTIKDVAVIGIPHEKWGEAVMAVVVLHQDMAFDEVSLRSWCRKHLAGFKCPSAFKVISEQDMPRTATGKILHRSLRGKFHAEPSNFVSVLNS